MIRNRSLEGKPVQRKSDAVNPSKHNSTLATGQLLLQGSSRTTRFFDIHERTLFECVTTIKEYSDLTVQSIAVQFILKVEGIMN